jgi:hypothetical protein
VAIESAGVTLVSGDLRDVVRAKRVSQATMRNIRQNLFFALVYNSIGVPIATGILYPFFGLVLSHDCQRGEDVRFRFRHLQRAAAEEGGIVNDEHGTLMTPVDRQCEEDALI